MLLHKINMLSNSPKKRYIYEFLYIFCIILKHTYMNILENIWYSTQFLKGKLNSKLMYFFDCRLMVVWIASISFFERKAQHWYSFFLDIINKFSISYYFFTPLFFFFIRCSWCHHITLDIEYRHIILEIGSSYKTDAKFHAQFKT